MDNLNKEILKYVISKLIDKQIPPVKIVVQKLLFFLRESGVPISYNYGPYAYGPYSKKLGIDADELVFSSQLEISGFEYRKGDNFSCNLNKTYQDLIDNKIEEFISLVEDDFRFTSMELFGTTLYCIRLLEETGSILNYENIIQEFKSWKGNKYPEEGVKKISKKLRPSLS